MECQLGESEWPEVLNCFKGTQASGVFLIVTVTFLAISQLAETILLCQLVIIERCHPFSSSIAGSKE